MNFHEKTISAFKVSSMRAKASSSLAGTVGGGGGDTTPSGYPRTWICSGPLGHGEDLICTWIASQSDTHGLHWHFDLSEVNRVQSKSVSFEAIMSFFGTIW